MLRQHLDSISLAGAQARDIKPPIPHSDSILFRLEQPQLPGTVLLLKRYRQRDWSSRLKTIIRGSRARHAFRWAQRLSQIGIPSLQAVAAGHESGRPWNSYFISVEVAPAKTLLACALAELAPARRRFFLRSLASLIAKLHDSGISYGDAHLANFLVSHPESAEPQLLLADLDGLRRFGFITVRRAARDLRRLIRYTPATPLEQVRFILHYCRARRGTIDPSRLLQSLQTEAIVKPAPPL